MLKQHKNKQSVGRLRRYVWLFLFGEHTYIWLQLSLEVFVCVCEWTERKRRKPTNELFIIIVIVVSTKTQEEKKPFKSRDLPRSCAQVAAQPPSRIIIVHLCTTEWHRRKIIIRYIIKCMLSPDIIFYVYPKYSFSISDGNRYAPKMYTYDKPVPFFSSSCMVNARYAPYACSIEWLGHHFFSALLCLKKKVRK